MNNDLYREYRFKFYLNANHYIIIDGKEGQKHPHTWEFMVSIAIDRKKFVMFNEYEREIEKFFDQYQNCLMNEKEPFNRIVPTIENMAEYFVWEINDIVQKLGGHLMEFESSETPTRSYVIGMESQHDYMEHLKRESDEKINDIISTVIDDVIKE